MTQGKGSWCEVRELSSKIPLQWLRGFTPLSHPSDQRAGLRAPSCCLCCGSSRKGLCFSWLLFRLSKCWHTDREDWKRLVRTPDLCFWSILLLAVRELPILLHVLPCNGVLALQRTALHWEKQRLGREGKVCFAAEMGSQGLGIQWLNQDLSLFKVLCFTSLDASSRSCRALAAGDVALCSHVGF